MDRPEQTGYRVDRLLLRLPAAATIGIYMSALRLRIPPVAVVFLTGLLMWVLAHAAPSLQFTLPGKWVLVVLFAAAGALAAIMGVATFRSARTTVNPLQPHTTSALVTSGIYRVTRNPMYLGMLLVLAAWAFALANLLTLVGPIGFILYMNRYQIAPEEAALTGLFGQSFLDYQRTVRRWL